MGAHLARGQRACISPTLSPATLLQLLNRLEDIPRSDDAVAEAQGRFGGVGGIEKIKGHSRPAEFREDFGDAGVLVGPVGGDKFDIVTDRNLLLTLRGEFLADGVLIGTVTTFPFRLQVNAPPLGDRVYTVRVTDNDGFTAEASRAVTITAGNLPPTVSLSDPAGGPTFSAPAKFTVIATAADSGGFIRQVDFRLNGALVLISTNSPYSYSITNAPLGQHTFTAVAIDNLGLASTSAPVFITVTRAVSAPLNLQVLHASDFEAGIPALEDAIGFSRVLNALRAEITTNTLTLSSGDNYIPGPFFTASADPAAPYNGVKGRADIALLNAFGIQASAAGNHEFDDNTPQFASMLRADSVVAYAGTLFPYLSANLDFNADSNTRTLITADGQDWRTGTNRVARSPTSSNTPTSSPWPRNCATWTSSSPADPTLSSPSPPTASGSATRAPRTTR